MPSIRRSLVAYFLLVLGLALGAVGLLYDQFSRGFGRGREDAEIGRIEQEFSAKCKESSQKFDDGLELQAQHLGRELRLKYFLAVFRPRERGAERESEEVERRARATLAAFLLVQPGPAAWAGVPPLAGASSLQRYGRPFYGTLERQHRDDLVRQSFVEARDQHPKYFQFHHPWTLRVTMNPHAPAELPPIPAEAQSYTAGGEVYKGSGVVAGEPVRVVILRTPALSGPRWLNPDWSRSPGTPALIGSLVTAVPPVLDPLPFVYVQAGRPRAELDAMIDEHTRERDQATAEVHEATQREFTALRVNLAVIAVLAFGAFAAGGWLLVGRGLAPVTKLSDAVSRVSEKDFRLPVERDALSHELLPIHDRLTHTLGALGRAFEREKQAVADISHELRTPIASLLTTLDVTLRKPRSAEQYKATLEECRDISKQLSRLVERIMTLAWLDAGNDRPRREEVNAAELAVGCATVIRPLAAANGLTFSTDLDPDARLVTDPDKLREVVMNLLHNAVEYNSPGGAVALSVGPSNGSVVFEVRDTGIGMAPDVADKIFERFYRADTSRTATGVHAGLGLSIVKEYVARLGGTITVDTAPGVGSTFRVTLPAKKAVPAREPVNV